MGYTWPYIYNKLIKIVTDGLIQMKLVGNKFVLYPRTEVVFSPNLQWIPARGEWGWMECVIESKMDCLQISRDGGQITSVLVKMEYVWLFSVGIHPWQIVYDGAHRRETSSHLRIDATCTSDSIIRIKEINAQARACIEILSVLIRRIIPTLLEILTFPRKWVCWQKSNFIGKVYFLMNFGISLANVQLFLTNFLLSAFSSF